MQFNKWLVVKKYKTLFLFILLMVDYKHIRSDDNINDILFKINNIAQIGLSVSMALYHLKLLGFWYRGPRSISPVKNIAERFDSVAGAQEAKEILKELADFLKNPEKYNRLGAKAPKGILLQGEPGNGKTLLARAMAGEANCAFYSVNGSEFSLKYVGEGADKIRKLFDQARKNAPSIIFIDEIDAIGMNRSSLGSDSASLEYVNVLNQLLTCMDGFEQNKKPVIVIGATNRANFLDKALLRPGRFDQIINVPYPDLQSRIEILELYIKKNNIDPEINLAKIAQGTFGFSGADLANLVNEAVVFATKKNKDLVGADDFEDARDKIIMGSESKTIVMTEYDRRVTAYHEAGHVLINLELEKYLNALHKVTITPRGFSLGATYSLPEREKYNSTKTEMMATIIMSCGGRVAEELLFNHITTGAQNDFLMATSIARQMVCDYGMSEDLGMAIYGRTGYSQKTAEQIDTAINKILAECYQRAKDIIMLNRDKLDKLASALLEKETMYASEIYELLGLEPRTDLRLTKV